MNASDASLDSATRVFEGDRPKGAGDISTIESHGIAPIPLENRYGSTWRNLTVWFAPNINVSGLFTGSLAVYFGLGFWQAVVAVVVGTVLGCLPVAYLARWGPQTGMGQLPLARLPFGKTIAVPALVQWISTIAWDALVGLFGAEALETLFHVPFAVGAIIILVIEGVMGFMGYELIHQFEKWASLLAVVFFTILAVRVIQHGGVQWHNTVHGGTAWGMFFLMVAISVSLGIGWATYAADYSRYMKPDASSGAIFGYTLAGLSFSYIWVLVLGAAAGTFLTDQTAVGVQHLMGGGLGTFGLIAMGIGAVASNQMNDYSGSLALQAAGVKVKRPYIAALVIIIAFGLIMWMHSGTTAAKFENLLLFTGYWVAPFAAVVMIDWTYREHGLSLRALKESLEFRNLESGWSALVALLVGFGAMVPFMNTELIEGPVAKALDGTDLSFYVGFVVTLGVYYVLRAVDLGRQKATAPPEDTPLAELTPPLAGT